MKKNDGYTLVEVIVVFIILGLMLFFMLFGFNPTDQLQKPRDAQRKHDLDQIATALTTYYNDHECFPSSIPFGSPWSEDGVVYMEKVPQDPDCTSKGYPFCYYYQVDGSGACPQWNILYANLYKEPLPADRCPMTAACGNNYNSQFNYCKMYGELDCGYIASNPIVFPTPPPGSSPTPTTTLAPTSSPTPGSGSSPTPTSSIFPSPTPTPTSTPTPTPTLTPTPTDICSGLSFDYKCTGGTNSDGTGPGSRCNLVPSGTGTYCTRNCNNACSL